MDPRVKAVRALQWKKLIDDQLASGKTQGKWCIEHDISESTFRHWKKYLQNKELDELYDRAASLGVTDLPETGQLSSGSSDGFAELPMNITSSDNLQIIDHEAASRDNADTKIDIFCGRFTVHVSGHEISESLLCSVLKAVAHAE